MIRNIKQRTIVCPKLMDSQTLLISFFFALFGFLSTAQEVTSSIDSTKIKIGEEIIYTINVQADSTDVVIFPEEQTFGPLEMIESYKTDTTFEAAKYRLIKKYGLTQFDSGRYTIPPQRIFINNQPFFTDSIKVEVKDVVVDTTKQKMFDIKPAVEVKGPPFNWLLLLYWLLPIIGVIALTVYLFQRKKRKDAAEKQLPPYEEAIFALKKLDNSQLLRSEEHTSELESRPHLVCRLLLEKKKKKINNKKMKKEKIKKKKKKEKKKRYISK